MLVGRGMECERIEGLIEQARSGDGGLLVVSGEPGVGKSALLGHALEHAAEMRVLRATGVAWEAELAFSGLLELLGPILGHLNELPEPQRRALEGALALGPVAEVDRFAVGAASLGLLAFAAATRPLLIVVDDAHCLDSASLEALVFAARRLTGEPLAVVLAVRAGYPTALDAAGLPTLAVGRLDRNATATLARDLLGGSLNREQIDRIYRTTNGLPLAIGELSRLGDVAEEVDAPLPISRTLELAYARDVERCDADVRMMLLVAAADDSGDVDTITTAAATLGLDAGALDRAEASGFIDISDGTLAFRHPLVRSAVYQSAPAPARRAVHAALADSLSGEWRADRRAWHRAAGALGPDERIAAELEATAQRTRARGGYATAARALERAAHLTPDTETQARRLVTAAEALWHAGQGPHAEQLLVAALTRTSNPLLRARANHVRGRLAHFRGDPAGARALLVEEGAQIAHHDQGLAAEMLATAVLPALFCGDRQLATETAATAARLSEHLGPDPEPGVAAQIGRALAVCGRLEAAKPYLQRSIAAAQALTDSDCDPQTLAYAADSHGWMSRYPEARQLASVALERAREQGAVSALAYAALHLTDYEIALGHLAAAVVTAGEAQRVAHETDEPQILAWSTLYLAQIAGIQGQRERSRAYLQDAQKVSVPLWFNGIDAIEWVRGTAQLVAGDVEEAIGTLLTAIGHVAAHTNWVPWTASADLIEAYVRAGRLSEASDAVQILGDDVQQGLGPRGARSRTRPCRPKRLRRPVQGSGRGVRQAESSARGGSKQAVLGRAASPRRAPHRGTAAAPQRALALRPATSPTMERPGSRRTARHRRDRAAATGHHIDRRAHPPGAAGRAHRCSRPEQQGRRSASLPFHQDNRGPPAPQLSKAGHPQSGRTRPGTRQTDALGIRRRHHRPKYIRLALTVRHARST
jgi:tetratricopeptide (TPR) repeat protein